jgi:branched-chain amino acid transport system permease protein
LFGGLLGAVVLFLPRDVFPTVTGYWRRKQARRPAPAERAPADPGAAAVPDHGPRQDGDARQDGADDALEARGLVKTFGGLRAVDGADLVVAAARVTGLIGPNGSGKTTLSNLVFRPALARRVTAAERARAIAVLDELGLAAYADTSPAELSYGQRKLVEIAQVLWLDPVLVLMDESAARISPALAERLAGTILSLHWRGIGAPLSSTTSPS